MCKDVSTPPKNTFHKGWIHVFGRLSWKSAICMHIYQPATCTPSVCTSRTGNIYNNVKPQVSIWFNYYQYSLGIGRDSSSSELRKMGCMTLRRHIHRVGFQIIRKCVGSSATQVEMWWCILAIQIISGRWAAGC